MEQLLQHFATISQLLRLARLSPIPPNAHMPIRSPSIRATSPAPFRSVLSNQTQKPHTPRPTPPAVKKPIFPSSCAISFLTKRPHRPSPSRRASAHPLPPHFVPPCLRAFVPLFTLFLTKRT